MVQNKLLFLIYTTADLSAQGTKLSSIKYKNSFTSLCNAFINKDLILILIEYSKTDSLS